MTEDEARAWVADRYPDGIDRLSRFLTMVVEESGRQNLIAPSTIRHLWARHVVDSLQLVDWAKRGGLWTDIGTGGGFPGMVVAIVRSAPIRLIEPRQRRAAFLKDAAGRLKLEHVDVIHGYAERVVGPTEVISARAVAAVDALIDLGKPWATPTTRWILPRGKLTDQDMATLSRRFGQRFHVEQSITATDSAVVVAEGMAA